MDLQLDDFAMTLAIGGVASLSLGYAFCLILGSWHPPDRFLRVLRAKEWHAKLFALVVIFALGMFAEDGSNMYVDAKTDSWPILRSENESRLRALFEAGGKPDDLILDLSRRGAFSAHADLLGREIDEYLTNPRLDRDAAMWCSDVDRADQACQSSRDEVEKAASRVYYAAKNRVYMVPQYYDELSKLQQRIDFARSGALLAIGTLVLAFVVLAAKGLAAALLGCALTAITRVGSTIRNSRLRSWMDMLYQHASSRLELLRLGQTAALVVAGWPMFGAFYVFGWSAHAAEEWEFNRRAYGYYASLLRSERSTRAEAGLRTFAGSAVVFFRTSEATSSWPIQRPILVIRLKTSTGRGSSDSPRTGRQ